MRTSLISLALASVLSLSITACATSGSDDLLSEEADEATSAGKLSLWQSTDSQWRFNVKSGNGAVLLTSEGYTTRMGAINGALSVLENGVDPAQYVLVPATHGFVVHLKAGNLETIATTQVYATKSSATRGVTSSVKAVTSYLDRRESTTTGARFAVTATEAGYHFNVHAKNGQVVLSSESYDSEAAAYNGAYAVQKDGQTAARYTIKESASGSFYFTLTSTNGQVIGSSQQYTTRQAAAETIASLTALLPTLSPL